MSALVGLGWPAPEKAAGRTSADCGVPGLGWPVLDKAAQRNGRAAAAEPLGAGPGPSESNEPASGSEPAPSVTGAAPGPGDGAARQPGGTSPGDLGHGAQGAGDQAQWLGRSAPSAAEPPGPRAPGSVPVAGSADVSRETSAPGSSWPQPGQPRILTIANQKGGVGKTTSAVNIGAALAQHGLRCLVVDLDPQGNASTALGVPHGPGCPSMYEVVVKGRALAEVVVPCSEANLTCAPATIDLAGAEIELVPVVAREMRLRRALAAYLTQYSVDYVLIDCPPSLGLLTVNALVAAREVLIPVQCEYYALEGLSQLVHTIELVRTELNPELDISTLLLTMYDARTKLADAVAADVRAHFGPRVLESVIPRSVRISEAPGFGQTILGYDPGSRGALAYLSAAAELAGAADPVAVLDIRAADMTPQEQEVSLHG